MVRDRDRRLPERLDIRDKLLNAACAVEKAVLGVDVEMNKWIQAETPPSLLFLSNSKEMLMQSQNQCFPKNNFFLLYHIS